MCINIATYMCIYIHVTTYACMYVYACTYICIVCIALYIYIYIYIYLAIHIKSYVQATDTITRSSNSNIIALIFRETSTACGRLICSDSVESFIFTCQTVWVVWTSTCSASNSTSCKTVALLIMCECLVVLHTSTLHWWWV